MSAGKESKESKEAKSRTPFIGGNWKSNGTVGSVQALVEGLNKGRAPDGVDIVVAPVFIHLSLVQSLLKAPYRVAAQNCSATGCGAFTGEVSASQLKDLGLQWVILGHSERRQLFNDENVIAKKIQQAQKEGLNAIICLGESLQERKEGKTLDIVYSQLKVISDAVQDWSKAVIAYEPVWAIGTGLTATPDQAEEVHSAIRAWLSKHVNAGVATATRIIYGGSVKSDNAAALIVKPNIDGFLVGGASLIAQDFLAIINASKPAAV